MPPNNLGQLRPPALLTALEEDNERVCDPALLDEAFTYISWMTTSKFFNCV